MSQHFIQHPALNVSTDLIDICKPLQKLNITYFAHARISHDNRFTALVTNASFLEHYLQNKYYNADIHVAKEKLFSKYIIWDAMEYSGESARMLMEARDFGHQHIFTITQQSEHGNEFYHFATKTLNPLINQTYINNIDLLEKFIGYFNQTVQNSPELLKSYKNTFGIDEDANYHVVSDMQILEDNSRQEFLASLQALAISTETPIKFTPKQTHCLQYLLQGLSAKEISRKMNISPRTVEHHIEKVKQITGSPNVKKLIADFKAG